MIALALVCVLAAQEPTEPVTKEATTTEATPTDATPTAATPTDATTTQTLPEVPALTAAQQAEILIGSGRALEATALLVKEDRAGTLHDPARAAVILARAADALADSGDIKAAAVAADAGWRLGGQQPSPQLSHHVVRYARVVAENDAAAGRALAERALAIDADNADAKAMLAGLDGLDTWTTGHLTLFGGVGLAALSAGAFVYGFDVERQARGGTHDTAELDGLLIQRGVAAGVAWPAAVAAVVAGGFGLALIIQHEEAVPSTLPASFPPVGAGK